MNRQQLIVYEKPKLKKPYLVAGFEGWPDAGKVSSQVAGYLRDKLGARRLAEVKPDDFYLYQSPGAETSRPVATIEDGLITALRPPATTFWFHRDEKLAHDLIILLGREPELKWDEYVNVILELAQNFSVKRIYAVGGTYDVVPHTVEPLIGAVLSAPGLEPEIRGYRIHPVNYRGPSSIHSTLIIAASKMDIEVIGLWGYVPHYVQVPNTKVCHRVLSKLAEMLGIPLDLGDIKRESEQLDEMVDKAVAQKPELQDYVGRLEAEYDKGKSEVGEPLGEDVIKEIEDFLKGRGGG